MKEVDFETMPIGTTFYHVTKRYNLSNNRLTMTDEHGNVWYRYDKPQVEYLAFEYELTGRLNKIVDGYWSADSETETEYQAKSYLGKIHEFYPETDDVYFLDGKEAESEAERLNKEWQSYKGS